MKMVMKIERGGQEAKEYGDHDDVIDVDFIAEMDDDEVDLKSERGGQKAIDQDVNIYEYDDDVVALVMMMMMKTTMKMMMTKLT